MKVFISYAREDRELVRVLSADLRALGGEVWFDEHLVGGQGWWDQIVGQLQACDVYVFAVSPDALDSTPCTVELEYALALRRFVLPVQVRTTPTSFLPPSLAEAQIVDYCQADKASGFALAAAVSGRGPTEPLPQPVPEPPTMPAAPLHELKVEVDRPTTLTRQQQLDLVDRLEREARIAHQHDDVASLLTRARDRPDIIGDIRDRIDRQLTVMGGAAAATTPSATKSGGVRLQDLAHSAFDKAKQASAAPARTTTSVASTAPAAVEPPEGTKWSSGALWGLVALSLFTAGVGGIIVGGLNLSKPGRRGQATLLVVGSVIWLLLALSQAVSTTSDTTSGF